MSQPEAAVLSFEKTDDLEKEEVNMYFNTIVDSSIFIQVWYWSLEQVNFED